MSKPIRYWKKDKRVDAILKKFDETFKSSFHFETFDNGRITKGYLIGVRNDALRVIRKMVHNSPMVYINVWNKSVNEGGITLPVVYQAQAVCDPKDTIDEEVGKKIVQQKLLDAYHADFDKAMVNILTHLTHSIARVKKYCYEQDIDISDVPMILELIEHPDYLLSIDMSNEWEF